MDTFIAVIILILVSEIWIPLALLVGFLKLVVSFSISAAWLAAISVPIWIWGFVHSLF